jgi:hypothetical protein
MLSTWLNPASLSLLLLLQQQAPFCAGFQPSIIARRHSSATASAIYNIYDGWRANDSPINTMHLSEENAQQSLQEFIDSDYGKQMFGCHELPASHGMTGDLSLVELMGPTVVLELSGAFWHRRETVLGRAAMWLNARMPEVAHVTVQDKDELDDYEEIRDQVTGEVLYVKDKRAPDFNGDRETMEYQGLDPDVRGPFPNLLGKGGPMINPV